jgi:hypothetical protein
MTAKINRHSLSPLVLMDYHGRDSLFVLANAERSPLVQPKGGLEREREHYTSP